MTQSGERVWTVHQDGQQYGPYTIDEICGHAAAGQMSPQALAWKEGMAAWVTVERLAASAPPTAPTVESCDAGSVPESPATVPYQRSGAAGGARAPVGRRGELLWPELNGVNGALFWGGVVAIVLVAASTLFNCVSIFTGGLAAIAIPAGKILAGAVVVVGALVLVALYNRKLFAGSTLFASSFGIAVFVCVVYLLYMLIAKPGIEPGLGMLVASQVGPGAGLYLCLFAAAGCAACFTALYWQQAKRRKRASVIPIFLSGACAAAAGVICIASYPRLARMTSIADNPAGVWGAGSPSVDPRFTISRREGTPWGTFADCAWWEVVNQDASPLIVSSVGINGEFSCPNCYLYPNGVAAPTTVNSYPVTLTIGESGYFGEFAHDVGRSSGYTKEVVFLDIDTNRGKFRYRQGQGFERVD